MNQVTIGVRDLKAHLSHYLRRVKSGETILVTERGKPVGRLVPLARTSEARLAELVEGGIVRWSGRQLPPVPVDMPRARIVDGQSVADLLLEDRA